MSLLTALPSNFATKRVDWIARTPRRQISPAQLNAEDVFLYSIPQVQESGTGALVRGDEVESNKWEINAPCLLVSRLNPRKSTICRATPQESRTLASTEFVLLETGSGTDSKFLEYVLTTPGVTHALSALATSATRSHQRVSPKDITSLGIPWPGADVRKEITSYLDHETAEIDAFITDSKLGVNLLEERQRASLLSWFIDPGQGSGGIPLGRYLTKLERPPLEGSGVVTAFRDGRVTGRWLRREEGFTVSETENGYQGVAPGDLVFHGLDGFAGAVGVSDSQGNCSPVYHVMSALQGADQKYMAYHLRALGIDGFLASYAWSVRQRSVDYRNWRTFAALPTVIPSEHDQRDRVQAFEELVGGVQSARGDLLDAIELAEERKAALISAAVTGQVDTNRARRKSTVEQLEDDIREMG